jgi:hypothetical protein
VPDAASFQSLGVEQGRDFARQCDIFLASHGFELGETLVLRDIGVEIDRVATAPSGRPVWFEYKGSVRGVRPGLLRTDTLKKAIANGALIHTLADHPPYVVLTSHLPTGGSGAAMLARALEAGYLHDALSLYDQGAPRRLGTL